MTTMGIWISVLVVLFLVHVHDFANSKNGCGNAVTVIISNGTHVYACQAQNKDNIIKWISNGAGMQNVLATCLNGSTTCLTTGLSVNASRTETGRSELRIVGSVDGSNIECHESSDSEEVTCLQSTTVLTTSTGPGNQNSDNKSTPSTGPEENSKNSASTQFVVSVASSQDVTGENTPKVSTALHKASDMLSEQSIVTTTSAPTGESSQYSKENRTSIKTTMTSFFTLEVHPITDATVFYPQSLQPSENTQNDATTLKTKSTVSFISGLETTIHITPTQVLTTTEKKQQVSSVSGGVSELSSQSNLTKLSAQSGITESQTYVSTEIIGEGTSLSGAKLTASKTTIVPSATDSPQTKALEDSYITNFSEISSQTNTGYPVFASVFTQISGSAMSLLPVSPEYSLSTESEFNMASTTDSHQNNPHVTTSLSSVFIVSSTPMPFVEASFDDTQKSVSLQDNTKGSYSGESPAFVSLTPELLSSIEGFKSRPFTNYPENLTSKSSLRTELASPFTSKIARDEHFTILETVTSSQHVQEVLRSAAHTNKVYLHTSSAFIQKETELVSRGKTEVIASVKPTMTTSPLHETESTDFRSLTALSTLNTQNVPTIDTVIASPKLKTDGVIFDKSLKTDDVSIQSHQGSVATDNPYIYSNTFLSSTYVFTNTTVSRSSSLEFTQSTIKNHAGFSDQETTIIPSAQEELHSTFRQDVMDVTKLPTGFSTHETNRTIIDVQTSTEADMYGTLSNSLRSITEVRTTTSQMDVQTHRGTSGDTKPAKNNTVNQDHHNILGAPSTAGPIPTSHDKSMHVSLIVGVIAAVLGVVVLGSLYILICKHHRESMTFSDDVANKEFIYCNIAYENEVNDKAKKVREAPSGVDKNQAPLTVKKFRRLSLSKTCVLREEIESPYGVIATDANSVDKVSTASVSMETESVSINSGEGDDMDSDVSLFSVTNPDAFSPYSSEENASESQVSDCPDAVTQHEEDQKDLFSPYPVLNRGNLMPPTPRKAFIWRPLYDRMLSKEDEPEDTLYTIVIAKPSRFRRTIMKSRGLLEPVDENEEDLLNVAAKKPKKSVSFVDAEYTTVSKVNNKPEERKDSEKIQLQDKCPDSLLPPVYAAISKSAPD